MHIQKIRTFTSLRFVMILIIMVSHFDFITEINGLEKYFWKFLVNTNFPIDFFFLLSGFGMMCSNINRIPNGQLQLPKPAECIQYGISHIKKLYPVYAATLLFGLAGNFIQAFSQNELNSNFLFHEFPKFFVNLLLMQSLTGMTFFTHAYNGAAWFLSCLLWIYIISPAVIYCIRKHLKSITANIILICLNIFMIVFLAKIFYSIEVNTRDINHIPTIDYLVLYSPFRRIFYVITGMNLSIIYKKILDHNLIPTGRKSNLMETAICAAAIIYYFIRNSLPLIYRYQCIIDVILCSIFVLIFAFESGIISGFLQKDSMQILGKMTMYIYIIHYPIRMYIGKRLYEHFVSINYVSATIEILIIAIPSFLLSYLLYKKDSEHN